MNPHVHDEAYMRLALDEAEKGRGWTHPNPMVGAVIVRGTEVVGVGYHARPGGPHAEVRALEEAGDAAEGATAYVTLEPCNHHGRTPPCTDALIRARVRRVVAAVGDPNPRTNGQARAVLESAGIRYEEGLLDREASTLNADFFHWVRTGLPRVILKMAATMDGRIATHLGESRWITGAEARAEVHAWRATVAAVMVGGGTLRADDPSLDARLEGAHQPLRVVVSQSGNLPASCRAWRAEGQVELWRGSTPPRDLPEHVHHRILPPCGNGGLDLAEGLRQLGQGSCVSLLVEGGGELAAQMLRQGLVDELRLFLAPRLLGGHASPSWFGGPDPDRLDQGLGLAEVRYRTVGEDLLVTGRPVWSPAASLRYDGAVLPPGGLSCP